jgi:hypothetical protein
MSRWRYVIAIDPGKTGGIACISIKLGDASAEPLPGQAGEPAAKPIRDRLIYLAAGYPAIVAIEKQSSRPGQSSVATFSHGRAYQAALDAASFLEGEVIQVSPQEWKEVIDSELRLIANCRKPTRKHQKEAAKLHCSIYFPGVLPTGKRGALPDGPADALCIAEYIAAKVRKGEIQ